MRDFDRNHKGNLPVIKGIVWCHEKSLASFGCCFVTRGSDARADPCVIIRKCPCDFVLTKQITERALPPIPDGGGGGRPARHHWPPAHFDFSLVSSFALSHIYGFSPAASSALLFLIRPLRASSDTRRWLHPLFCPLHQFTCLPSSSSFPPLSSSCF